MKKQVLLFMAGGVLAFASCNQPTETGMSDEQIDSTVNARVEEIRAEMMAQNDSMINVLAMERADSIIAAMKGTGSKSTGKKTTTTKTTTTTEEVKKTPDSKSKWGTEEDKASKSKWGKTEEEKGSKSKWGK
jgi:hypothetical protein